MSIQYPVRIGRDPDTPEVHIRDASNCVIAAHLVGIIAQEIVDALNAQRGGKRKSKRTSAADELKRSDLTAQLAERDNIIYGSSDSIPGGEHIIRLGAAKKLG
jgi:hypothetical protein